MAKAKVNFNSGRYVCTEKCYHNSILFEVGMPAVFNEKLPPPLTKEGKVNHFKFDGDVEAVKVDLKKNEDDKNEPVTGSVPVDDLGNNNTGDLTLTGNQS